ERTRAKASQSVRSRVCASDVVSAPMQHEEKKETCSCTNISSTSERTPGEGISIGPLMGLCSDVVSAQMQRSAHGFVQSDVVSAQMQHERDATVTSNARYAKTPNLLLSLFWRLDVLAVLSHRIESRCDVCNDAMRR
ncbi:MAG TPA: hypothetical protein VFK05_14385, partial [Polyangiaceae bacterium]|nr:hypothetical protein [Polyangiaceae bacterium]